MSYTAPSLEQVLEYATTQNIPEQSARKFFLHYSAVNWQDAQGRLIVNWKAKLDGWHLGDLIRGGTKSHVQLPPNAVQSNSGQRHATTEEAQRERWRKVFESCTRFYGTQIQEMVRYGVAQPSDFDDNGYKIV